jgi:cytochrome P450
VHDLDIAEPNPTAAASAPASPRGDGCPPFRVDDLRLHGLTKLFGHATENPPQWIYGLLRTLLPLLRVPEWRYLTPSLPFPRLKTWLLATRREDVEEILSRDQDFGVPFGEAMKLLISGDPHGINFILGLEDGGEYRTQLRDVMQCFRRDDAALLVAPLSRDAACRIVDGCNGRLDAIADLVAAVPVEICERYYGIPIPAAERPAFVQWAIAMSGYIFGPPFDQQRTRDVTIAGACRVRALVDRAIDDEIAKAQPKPECGSHSSALARLACEHAKAPASMSRDVMRAFMMGMITGFVPTNIVSAGHILETLLDRPDLLAAARGAAASGDDDLLSRCLFESMRFRPLNPGQWRVCLRDCTVARGKWRERKLRKGTYVLASTQSAMFDPRSVREPNRFDPARAASDSMLFGYGLHWCVGRFLADAQITQTLKALVTRTNLRRAQGDAGRMRKLALFPEHLVVEFDS